MLVRQRSLRPPCLRPVTVQVWCSDGKLSELHLYEKSWMENTVGIVWDRASSRARSDSTISSEFSYVSEMQCRMRAISGHL